MGANTTENSTLTTSVTAQDFTFITTEIFTLEYGKTTPLLMETICSEMAKVSKDLSKMVSKDMDDIAMPTAISMRENGVMTLNMESAK